MRQDVRLYANSSSALKVLEDAHTVRVLITGIEFPPGQPNGVVLANMGRLKRPDLKVIFLGPSESERHTTGLGELFVPPFNAARIAARAMALLDSADQRKAHSPIPK